MSQSNKVIKEFGNISLSKSLNVKTGSVSAPAPVVTPAPVSLADAAVTLTAAQVQAGIVVMTPTTGRNVTLPSAASLATVCTAVGDSLDLFVVNLGADTVHLTIVSPSTAITGSAVVRDSDPTAASASGSAHFRVRMTNVSSGTEAYSTIRLA